jgi:hypothetical protein
MDRLFDYKGTVYTYTGCKAEDLIIYVLDEIGGKSIIDFEDVPEEIFNSILLELGY